MTYERLKNSLQDITGMLENCPYPKLEIVPDDPIIHSLNEIIANIMFENDERNYNPRKVDA